MSMNLTESIKDEKMIKHLYLDLTINELIEKMNLINLIPCEKDDLVPFFAKVRGYMSAVDQFGENWLIKEISAEEVHLHKVQEIAYYVDVLLKTLAAPTIVSTINGKTYRATKIIEHAMQAGSYNYLEEPLKKMLANDLINRWLFFDEDRNPNNYLIFHDSDNTYFPIVIDYNKADLEIQTMKISGDPNKFGWLREEKTRFLTLLKPENFESMHIEDFEERLQCLMSITEKDLIELCKKIFTMESIDDVESTSTIVTNNIISRAKYLNYYFRKWFKKIDKKEEKEIDDRYSGLGKSFMDYYKDES
ncbi:hypothetical protein HNV09_025515 [Oceanispirochaeta sp. M2]|nr:hypothetical protein [Oceanispirochaeta sp. M2]NPD75496.1 hypothetical protein [Oceanispirochaeta sp. M1]RDG28654.1 hypothetical protein DV872_25715 [Oceanispirochaeta sp. M1]